MSLRYKARGTIATDLHGTRDTVEFLNIAQDDALSWPRPTHRIYPPTVNERMKDAVTPFVRKSMAVNNTILDIFERLLGLPRGALADLHTTDKLSGSEARVVKTPPNQSSVGIGAHTDFGTLVSIPGLLTRTTSSNSCCFRRHSFTTVSEGSRSCHLVRKSGFT